MFSWPCSPKLSVKVIDEDSKPAAGGLKPPTKDEADSSDMVCISQSIYILCDDNEVWDSHVNIMCAYIYIIR